MEQRTTMLKRYMLFVGDNFYPCGGLEDFYGDYDTYDEAKAKGEELTTQRANDDLLSPACNDWYQILDLETCQFKDMLDRKFNDIEKTDWQPLKRV